MSEISKAKVSGQFPKMYIPAKLSMDVTIINDTTGQAAAVTIDLGAGKVPTLEQARDLIESCVSGKMDEIAPGFRLPNKKEFLEITLTEMAGEQVAVAIGTEWDQP